MRNYLRYVYAILAVPVAVLLRFALTPLTGPGIPYITLFPVTVGVALLAGLGPSVLTGLLSSIVIDYFFLEPIHTVTYDIAHLTRASVLVLTSAFVGYVGDTLRAARAKAEKQALALRDSQADLNRAQSVANTGNWRMDVQKNELTWSDENHRIFGIPQGTPMTYETFLSTIYPGDRDYVDKKWKAALAGEPYDIEHRIVVNGEIKWVRETTQLEFDSQGTLLGGFGATQDITEQRKKQEELHRLNRTLRALGNSSQAMMHAEIDEADYLKEVCNIIVRDCGHAMVWIGLAEEDANKTVRPEASFGFDEGYLKALNITYADSELGRGPTGTAIRSGKPAICRNILTDPKFEPWRKEAIKRGYASSVALPLISDGKTFGALTIYSRESDPFSEDEVELLTKLADDLAYGIDAIRFRIEHSKAEEAVRQSRDELEIRVKERTAELAESVAALQKQVQQRIQAETALRNNEQRYRSLVVATTQIVWTTDAMGQVVGDMPSWRDFTGQTIEEIQGWGWINSLHPDDRDRTVAIWSEAVRTHSLYQTEYRIRRQDGKYRYAAVRGVPVLEQDGSIREWVGTCTDITESRTAEQNQSVTSSLLDLFAKKTSRKEYLDSVVEVIRNWSGCEFIGIRIKDKDGNIPYESYVGFDNDFLALENALHLGRDNCVCIRAILQNPQQQERKFITAAGSFYCNDSKAFLAGLSEQQCTEYRGNCIKWGFSSISIVPVRHREEIMGVIHLADFQKDMVLLSKVQFVETSVSPLIGEAVNRFDAESELEKYRLHLEELVNHRTAELEQANSSLQLEIAQRKQITDDLASSNEDLEQFAYVASHDLQEPLRAVAGFVELLKMRLQSALDAKTTEYMSFTTDGVKRMQSLINGLLEYSRIGTRGNIPQMTDSKTALERAIANLQFSINESGAKILVGSLPMVRTDPMQLAQLFQNLINNAIKFRRDVAPEIRITATRRADAWQFAVADNGIGIDSQYAHRIFLIFQRLHTRGKYPGTGIGLAICKKIVERHGGKIWVESKPQNGSTFYFTIPDIGEN